MWPATSCSLASSRTWYPCVSPSAIAMRVKARSRPWSEWADVPAATWRAKVRAATVPNVAPHTPRVVLPTKRHGPILQILQHLPSTPMGHGLTAATRLKTVEAPLASAISSISQAAGSILRTGFSFSLAISHFLHLRAKLRLAYQTPFGLIVSELSRHLEVGLVGLGHPHTSLLPPGILAVFGG